MRFTYRENTIRIFGAGYWRKEKKIYAKEKQKKIKYTDEPMNNVEVIADFLPPPEALAFKDETVKITIAFSKSSVDFFQTKG